MILAPMRLVRAFAEYRINRVLKGGSVREIQSIGRILQGVNLKVEGAKRVGLILEHNAEQIALERGVTIQWE